MAKLTPQEKQKELIEKRKAALAPLGFDITQEVFDMNPQKFNAYVKKLIENKTTTDEADKEAESKKPDLQVDAAEEKKVREIMAQLQVDTVYLTTDGYWFTQESLAKVHEQKIGGEIKVFTNKTK